MTRLGLLLLLLVSTRNAPGCALAIAGPEWVVDEETEYYVLDTDEVRVSVAPASGGRIVGLKLFRHDFLYFDPLHDLGGDVARVVRAEGVTTFAGPFVATVDGATLTLRSKRAMDGLRWTRVLQWNNGRLSIADTVTNESASVAMVSPSTSTTIVRPAMVVVAGEVARLRTSNNYPYPLPTLSPHSLLLNEPGAWWVREVARPTLEKSPDSVAVLRVRRGTRNISWFRRFAVPRGAEYFGDASLEIANGGLERDWFRLALRAPIATLQEGESTTLVQEWWATSTDRGAAEADAAAGNDEEKPRKRKHSKKP